MQPAFYDEKKTYEQNFSEGPPIGTQNREQRTKNIVKKHKFLGFDINTPFGIPAGPLLNSMFMKAAFEWGYDVSTYKTVRSDTFPCHPFPNVLDVRIDGELHPDITPRLTISETVQNHRNITNSFGVPSRKPSEWQEDVKKALTFVGEGQLMILSFMGTVKPDQTQREFVEDFALAARLAKETGAKVLEANLSCPNIGNEGLVCYNVDATEAICKAIREAIGTIPLILKIGYYKDQQQLSRIARIAAEYAEAVAAINTLQVEVVDKRGNQALPGPMRLKSGVCGAGIKWAGLEMVKNLSALKEQYAYSYEVVGVGGVMNTKDYDEYRSAGARLVQAATGAMWNANLANDIAQTLRK